MSLGLWLSRWFCKCRLIRHIVFGSGLRCRMCGGAAHIGVVFVNGKYHVKYFCSPCYDVCLSRGFFRYVLEDDDWRSKVSLVKKVKGRDDVVVDDFVDVVKLEELSGL